MTLTSFTFFAFFAMSLAVYYICPLKCRWLALLVFSLGFFLLSATPYTLVYLIGGIVSVHLCARGIANAKKQEKPGKAKGLLILGIVLNAGLLAVLKYNGFVIFNVNRVLGMLHISKGLPELGLVSPLGISFYTFTALGYLLDTYWGMVEPAGNMLKTALFIGYYPQLTSGPITRYGDMSEKLFEGHRFDYDRVTFGLQRLLWGVFKKIVISARLGIIVDTIYGNTMVYNGLYIWLAAVLFMFQLYTDFSGCMDIVLGASECYGVILPENFRTPFFSRSVQEYWQRWHITLGGWLRDYIMYPVMRSGLWRRMTKWTKAHLGKRAAKQLPSYLAMLCVWLLMGLWHGGSWKYIIGMGLWFWGLIVLSQVCEPLNKKLIALLKINTDCFSWHLFQSLRVFFLVMIGNMFFRLDGLGTTLRAIKAGLHFNLGVLFGGSIFNLGLDKKNTIMAVVSLAILLLVSAMQEQGKSVRKWLANQNLVLRWAVYICLIFGCLVFGMYGPGYKAEDFIYGQF